ncbi:hypothetical protein [Candidatus Nitrososphaera sp. FF02]|uniref:hypothetical protein n=1 Tax=Candidatus Nitrososphaera sp. FF02 TaxID=3398226 RepID=UPI0039E84A82
MIRFAAVIVLLMLASSALAVPAYSLAPGRDVVLSGIAESRPLTSLPMQPSDPDTVNIYGRMVPKSAIRTDFGAITLGDLQYNGNVARTLVMGSGDPSALSDAYVMGMGGDPKQGPFLGVAFSENPLGSGGFSYASDMPLTFDSVDTLGPGRLSGSSIIGSDAASERYDATGKNVTVAIVDTGTDFSNADMRHAVARDGNNVPIMLDTDGQGLVLTKAKYIAKINQHSGQIMNYTNNPKKPQLPENVTSYVYTNATGVYLRMSDGRIPVFNSLYPLIGSPVLSANANVDWKIGDGPVRLYRLKERHVPPRRRVLCKHAVRRDINNADACAGGRQRKGWRVRHYNPGHVVRLVLLFTEHIRRAAADKLPGTGKPHVRLYRRAADKDRRRQRVYDP